VKPEQIRILGEDDPPGCTGFRVLRQSRTGADGCAVGYYSHAAGEKAEMFFYVDEVFTTEYESFSKKMWEHKVTYGLYYQHFCLGRRRS